MEEWLEVAVVGILNTRLGEQATSEVAGGRL